jgi:hypothetical protein
MIGKKPFLTGHPGPMEPFLTVFVQTLFLLNTSFRKAQPAMNIWTSQYTYIEGIQRMFLSLIGFSEAVKPMPSETSETAVNAMTNPVKSMIGLLCERNNATKNQFM